MANSLTEQYTKMYECKKFKMSAKMAILSIIALTELLCNSRTNNFALYLDKVDA
jgi:hypothetical protein